MAGKRFRAMLNDNPKLDAARYGLAISQTRIGQLNDARDNLRQLLAKAPNDVAYNLAQVELDITANRLPDADQRLKKMLAQFPSSYPLKQVRADLMLKMGKPQESEKILDDLSKARPLDPDVWNRLAEVRSLTNNAIGVHQARAEYLSLTGDYQAAIEQLDFAKRRAGGNFNWLRDSTLASRKFANRKRWSRKCSAERHIRGKTPGEAHRNRGWANNRTALTRPTQRDALARIRRSRPGAGARPG